MLTLLVAAGVAGLGAAPAPAPQPAAPAAPPVHVQYIKIPPSRPAGRPAEISRLRLFIESGEKALEEKDWDGALAWSKQADDLVASLPEEVLKQSEVVSLRARLTEFQLHLPDTTEEVAPVEDPGLKESVEVGPLSPEDLRTEREQVQGAEMGAVFDLPIDLNDKVLAQVHQFTTSKRGFMERTLSRASQYLPMVRQIFAEEHIPQDLAYLAVIESGFINSATSYAKAVGMWQFMRSTGRIYGLGGNAWVEERRDPVKATRAAARYLRRLYDISGDWYLALAGYNAGPLTTERASLNLGTHNFWDMYRSRWLRNQTKNYVPELCAAILVGRFPERYGLKVEQLHPYTYETVDVDRMTSLAVLARFADTNVESLKELNPELLRATTPPGHYSLRVPPGQSGVTARALAVIPANQRLDFKPYKIRRGETLARVASRFNLSVEDLLDANNITKAEFRPGRVIQVPPPPVTPIDTRDLRSKVERAEIIEDRPLDKLPAIPPPSQVPPLVAPAAPSVRSEPEARTPAPRPVVREKERPAARIPAPEVHPAFHVVKRGETLFAIADRYGLDVKDLRKWNKLRKNVIQAGQKLRLKR
ncbi:MAG: LysM peptidoglycan-binding domain-containing protein [Holophaga sp.]|nr:LysM peptidoglycan-binding domain-containing protein [Holophaga sp.]